MRPSIEDIRQAGDFSTTYQWNFRFARMPRVLVSNLHLGALATRIVEGGSAFLLSKKLNVQCESSELPRVTQEKIPVNMRGFKKDQTGLPEFSRQITLTFYDTVDSDVSFLFKRWREMAISHRNLSQANTEDITGVIVLERLDRQDEPIWSYELHGCFLDGFEPPTLGAESEVFKAQALIAYDFFEEGPALSLTSLPDVGEITRRAARGIGIFT